MRCFLRTRYIAVAITVPISKNHHDSSPVKNWNSAVPNVAMATHSQAISRIRSMVFLIYRYRPFDVENFIFAEILVGFEASAHDDFTLCRNFYKLITLKLLCPLIPDQM